MDFWAQTSSGYDENRFGIYCSALTYNYFKISVKVLLQMLEIGNQNLPAEVERYYKNFIELYGKKLWHQLTIEIMNFINISSAAPFLLSLYETFIKEWEGKMNKIFYVQIMTVISKQLPLQESKKFLNSVADKMKTSVESTSNNNFYNSAVQMDVHAYILARMEVAHISLFLGEVDSCKQGIEECEKLLEKETTGVDPLIQASFYRVSADYNKAKSDYSNYYKNALLFLACVSSLDAIPQNEKAERAYDLALSALLGDTIYNFGELLMHPIIEHLKDIWLKELLCAFNEGNISTFERLTPNFSAIPLLLQGSFQLRQKLCLMAFVELSFKKTGEQQRLIPFSLVASVTKLPVNEVEHLIMRALSLGLIKGTIDQVDQVVKIDWVQPRVLDKNRISNLNKNLIAWSKKVSQITKFIENNVETVA